MRYFSVLLLFFFFISTEDVISQTYQQGLAQGKANAQATIDLFMYIGKCKVKNPSDPLSPPMNPGEVTPIDGYVDCVKFYDSDPGRGEANFYNFWSGFIQNELDKLYSTNNCYHAGIITGYEQHMQENSIKYQITMRTNERFFNSKVIACRN